MNVFIFHSRESSIKELLLRHIRLDMADSISSDSDSLSMSEDADNGESEYSRKEKFLISDLKIPSTWISEAKVGVPHFLIL